MDKRTTLIQKLEVPALRNLARKLRPSRKRAEVPRRPPHYTRLPPEIWLIIFREACLQMPDPLTASLDHSFLTSPSLSLDAYHAAMHVKTTLSLVNSRWNLLMRKELYEFIWLTRARQARALAQALKDDAACDWKRRRSGQWIARLHIQTSSTLDRCHPEDVHTILSYAPYLEEYTDHRSVRRFRWGQDAIRTASMSPSSPAGLCRLLAHPTNQLRRLAWTTYDDQPFDMQIAPVLTEPTVLHLEYLELTSLVFDLPAALPAFDPTQASAARLPALRSLKVSLDDTTFAILAGWEMPALRNLSVVSADFSYARAGFARFFAAHGAKVRQLELGHSSAQISSVTTAAAQSSARIHLAEWCPNLDEFVCSADAEWNWMEPDWIAPHVLLPAHPRLKIIGIRDIDKRVDGDGEGAANVDDPAPYFPLLEQMSSLLRAPAFPSLRFIRDLSEESHRSRMSAPQPRVTKMWLDMLRRCKERGVYLEDYKADSVRVRDLERASSLSSR